MEDVGPVRRDGNLDQLRVGRIWQSSVAHLLEEVAHLGWCQGKRGEGVDVVDGALHGCGREVRKEDFSSRVLVDDLDGFDGKGL
jgi:hypothetical protein